MCKVKSTAKSIHFKEVMKVKTYTLQLQDMQGNVFKESQLELSEKDVLILKFPETTTFQ